MQLPKPGSACVGGRLRHPQTQHKRCSAGRKEGTEAAGQVPGRMASDLGHDRAPVPSTGRPGGAPSTHSPPSLGARPPLGLRSSPPSPPRITWKRPDTGSGYMLPLGVAGPLATRPGPTQCPAGGTLSGTEVCLLPCGERHGLSKHGELLSLSSSIQGPTHGRLPVPQVQQERPSLEGPVETLTFSVARAHLHAGF